MRGGQGWASHVWGGVGGGEGVGWGWGYRGTRGLIRTSDSWQYGMTI